MKPLEDLTIGKRIVMTAVIVIVILLLLAAFGFLAGRWNEAGAQQPVPLLYDDIPLDATLIRMDKHALEEAYEQQLVKLFSVWLSQGAQDPGPITAGLRNARRAYNIAASQISRREQQLLETDRDRLPPSAGPPGPAGPRGETGPAGPAGPAAGQGGQKQ